MHYGPNNRIRLVKKEEKVPVPDKPRPVTRLTLAGFFADIIDNTDAEPPLFHWVVQREGDPEILEWGTHRTFEGARIAAQRTLEWRARHPQSLA